MSLFQTLIVPLPLKTSLVLPWKRQQALAALASPSLLWGTVMGGALVVRLGVKTGAAGPDGQPYRGRSGADHWSTQPVPGSSVSTLSLPVAAEPKVGLPQTRRVSEE